MAEADLPAAAAAAPAVPPRAEKLNARAAGVVGLFVLLSRLLGLVREQVFAGLFGGGLLMDAFTMAFRIPNLLRDLFAEGALSTAFVTTFSKTTAVEGEEAAWRLANKVATLAVIVVGSITVAGIFFAKDLVALLAPGFDPSKAALTVTLTQIMYPFILLVSLAALVMGMLNARNVFGVPAMSSSFFNLGSIIGGVAIGWALDPTFGPRALLGLAIGTVIGGALQLSVQVPALRRLGYVYRPDFAWRHPGVKAVLQLMGPSVVAASTTQVNVLINSVFASELGDGPTTWLSIAFRLMQLPLGVFGVALGTVSLPLLARMAAAGHTDTFRSELARGMRLAFLMTIPASVGLIVLADPIISVLYQHGRFNAHQAAEAAGALRYYAIGLSGYAALKVLVNAFYAIDHRKTPMMVAFLAVGLNLLLNWVFTKHLGWGHRGLAFSTACVATSNFLILYFLMRHHLKGLKSDLMLSLVGKVGLASAVLAAICWSGERLLLSEWAVQPLGSKVANLAAVIIAGIAGFVLCAAVLRVPELQQIGAAVARRLDRPRARRR